jgi:hypothetical protein
MAHNNKIWFELAWRVVQLYCPALKGKADITKKNCRCYLMRALSDHWEFDFDLLGEEQRFYLVLKGLACGEVMKEILAIFYYAYIDKTVAGEMPALFIAIAGKERNIPTPYYHRFVEEYKKEKQKPHARFVLPEPFEPVLREVKRDSKKWKMLKEMIKKIDREEK